MYGEAMSIMKLQFSENKNTKEKRWHLTVPAWLVEDKGWVKGDRILFVYDKDGNVVLKQAGQKR